MSVNSKSSDKIDSTCKICNSRGKNPIFYVKEMMLGSREEFTYFLCNICNCLQLDNPPANLEKFYASSKYYSFQTKETKLNDILMKLSFYQKGFLFRLFNHYLFLDYALFSIRKLNASRKSRILDVGAGNGDTILKLKKLGFENVSGIDPFIEKDLDEPVKVIKGNLSELNSNDCFDIIMFHHSFEHIPNPVETLLDAKKILDQNGTILIRTPIVSHAFDRYGPHWFQIDAPRHFFVYSIAGLNSLLEKTGLYIENYYCDSTENQFFWSESYANDISMNEAKRGPLSTISRKIFSPYRRQAILLNEQKVGDQAAFYIKISQ